MEISRAFVPLLSDFDVAHLDRHAGCVYGLWRDYALAFTNQAWNDFQAANGGLNQATWTLGANIFDAIPAVLRPFYREHFEHVLQEQRPWEHIYECSSPGAVRQFHMLTIPLPQRQGLLTIHSLRYEAPRNATTEEAPEFYADGQGVIRQCSHCRRVRNPKSADSWDWVPSLVRSPHPRTSHGLCPPCSSYYYGAGADSRGFPQSLTTIEPPSPIAQAALQRLLADPATARGEITRDFLRSRSDAFYSGFAG